LGWFSRFSGNAPAAPSAGSGRRVFAVGDVHGRKDLLDILLYRIAVTASEAPRPHNTLLFLGDYIDRGPDSRGVLETLRQLAFPGWDIVFLRGNHDQTFLDFLNDASIYRSWRSYGAPETLLSYGVRPPRFDSDKEFARARDELAAACPQSHLDFIDGLQYAHTIGDYHFVHAGVRPGVPLHEQLVEDQLWIREGFLSHRRAFEKVIVHGHTPAELPVRRSNRIGVDTGAHATGCLTAVVLDEAGCAFLDTGGDVLAGWSTNNSSEMLSA
jgi:serine/threonine protein phosphatase 1